MDVNCIKNAIGLLDKIIIDGYSSKNSILFENLKNALAEESPTVLKNKIMQLHYENIEREPTVESIRKQNTLNKIRL